MKHFLLVLASLSLLACRPSVNFDRENALAKIVAKEGRCFPKQVGYVNDFENLYSESERAQLERLLSDYEKESSVEIAVVTIDENLDFENFDQYALDLSNHWGIGKKNNNNGISIVISPRLKKLRISTGLGLENILTNEECSRIIQESIVLAFKEERYYEGTRNAIAEIIKDLSE